MAHNKYIFSYINFQKERKYGTSTTQNSIAGWADKGKCETNLIT